jgi:kynurenine formamidase
MTYIDLTHTFTASMPVWPGDAPVELKHVDFIDECGVNAFSLCSGMHVGTHIDAPLHMLEDGKMIHEYLPEKFIGKAHLIDARQGLNVADLEQVQEGDNVLVYTGHSKKFGTQEYYDDYPEITEKFARALVEKKTSIIGLDTCSPDRAPFPIHKILLGADILIIENMTNLDKLIGFDNIKLTALPLKLEAEASLLRVVAEV